MNSRRTFLKLFATISAFVIPWTVLPKYWAQEVSYLLGRPSVKVSNPSEKAPQRVSPAAEVLERKAMEDIQALSSLDKQGRRAGTAGETRALVYLQEQLEALHLKPFGDDQYWQMFSIPSMQERRINGRALFRPDEGDSLRMPAANILAGLEGTNREQTLLISAHYDHLGLYEGILCPGANDNASGVGCVLQVMRRLVKDSLQGIQPHQNIVAVLWGAEEMGFLGSKHFVKKPTIPLSQIQAVINFDTVANGEKKEFILWSSRENFLIRSAEKAISENGAEVEWVSGQGHHSDEFSFANTGIPAVTLLSRDWLSKNHTPQDDVSLINQEKLEIACAVLYDMVKEIAY